MSRKKQEAERNLQNNNSMMAPEESEILRPKTIKELIAPSGIDASNIDYLRIISSYLLKSFSSPFSFFYITAHFSY